MCCSGEFRGEGIETGLRCGKQGADRRVERPSPYDGGWRGRVPGHHPLAGPKRGADELIAYFAQLAIAGFSPEVVALVADDHYVVDVHRGRGSVGEDSVDMLWVLVYKIVDGRIAEVDNFAGDQHAADAFFTKVWGPRLKPVPDRFVAEE